MMFTETTRRNLTNVVRGILRSKAGQDMSTYEVGRRAAARYFGSMAQHNAAYEGNARAIEIAEELRAR